MDSVNSDQLESDSDGNVSLTAGKENMIGRAIFRGSEILCPVSTNSALAIAEQPELRAYKLGKQKCSYNQVELVIKDVGPGKVAELKVSEAIETCVGSEVDEQLRESCLKFNVRFVNNNRMHFYIYVVYATPYGTTRIDKQSVLYHWIPVTRSKCRKGCKGPVIRGLQRFGRMPRRSAATLDGEDSWKEPRHLYIAIDEASTHVCPRHETSKFRLLVAAYDDKNQLLGTTVSSSIRVLANNDAPLGAASFKLHCHIKGGWGAGAAESPSRNSHNRSPNERLALTRAPLQDILQNSSPPRSYKSTTTDETAKQADVVSTVDPLHEVDEAGVTNEKRMDQGFFSGSRSRRATVAEIAIFPTVEREHSLTDLCQRLFKACVVKQEHGQSTITLRGLSNSLGARRRRILEILNVLETVQVVIHQGKERYTWIGSSQISRALVKLKSNLAAVGETSRVLACRTKAKTILPQDMTTEVNNPMRVLSKRFVQLFLVHERGCSVRWEQILGSIVDGQGHDPETIRAKTRRLGEIARIFTALHLIKKAASEQAAGLVYEWLGAQGVAEQLVNCSLTGPDGLQREVKCPAKQGKRGPRGGRLSVCNHQAGLDDAKEHLEDLKETSIPSNHLQFMYTGEKCVTDQKLKRNFADVDENASRGCNFIMSQQKHGNPRLRNPSSQSSTPLSNDYLTSCGGYTLSAAYTLCQSALTGHIREEISSQLEASISRQLCQLPTWRVQGGSATQHVNDKDFYSSLSQAARLQGLELGLGTSTLDLDRSSCDLETLASPASSERADEGFTSPDKTDEGSTTTELFKSEVNVADSDSQPGTLLEGSSCQITNGCSKWQETARLAAEEPHEFEILHCNSVVPLEREEAFQQNKIGVSSKDLTIGSHSAAHQFPYKKRKFDVASFASVAESDECEHSRDSQLSQSQEHDEVRAQEHRENSRGASTSSFDPLFHLLCFNSPEQIFQLQSQNPAFLLNYVKESRALYHKWRSQSVVPRPLVRPVACVGKILSAPAGSPNPPSVSQPGLFVPGRNAKGNRRH